jgi:hypothetical protein
MTADDLNEELQHQRDVQSEYRKRLRVLERQAARFDMGYVPSHILTEKDDINRKLRECRRNIDELDIKIAIEARLKILHKAQRESNEMFLYIIETIPESDGNDYQTITKAMKLIAIDVENLVREIRALQQKLKNIARLDYF